jgi:transketolase
MTVESNASLDLLCINTIRTLSIDAVQNANSGHPGLPLGAAPMAYTLWQRHLRHNPKDPRWPDRDRFVLSAGHGSMLLYSLLHLTGYDLSLDDIRAFRQWESRTPGHPEFRLTPGVEATTGPLGQGSANAVGMAIAERALAHRFNREGRVIVDHHTYALVSDGDLMEGISAEAASLAGHLKLGKLIYLYDSNQVSLDGPTSLTFSTEDVGKRYQAYGWQVLEVADGNTDLDAIDRAIAAAKAETTRPSLIIVHTTIGYGSPHKQGTAEAHGSPLGVEEVALTKQALGWEPSRSFYIPERALAHFRAAFERGAAWQVEWEKRFEAYARAFPDLAAEWKRAWAGELPERWDEALPSWSPGKPVATREAAGKALNAIAARVPTLIGGDADLSSSTKTSLKDAGSFEGVSGAGRNLHFGVREHAMGGVVNGIAYHGGLRPFAATFFCFSDYMRPAVRLAALSELAVVYVWTHDSVGLGEDGPTHEPIEHLMSLRAMPNLSILRPADANEAAEAWRWALQHREGPVGLVLTRQNLPVLDRSKLGAASGLARGAYVLADSEAGDPQAIIIGTGSEVHVALGARELLAAEGVRVRVVSMPSWELFERESAAYRESVLPSSVAARVSVEAGSTFGWSRYLGSAGVAIGIDRFGASAPGEVNLAKLGITPERVADAVRSLLGREADRPAGEPLERRSG